MNIEGLKNVKITAQRSQMTFCASCKSCPAIDISTESDKVVVGGEDEGYTEFTKDQFELFDVTFLIEYKILEREGVKVYYFSIM